MAWLALADHDGQEFTPTGLGTTGEDATGLETDELLSKGTLLIETRLSPDGRPQDLLAFRGQGGWLSALTLKAIPGGGLTLVIAQNGEITHATILPNSGTRTDVVRVTYAWDAPKRWARLAIERPEGSDVCMASVANPKPIPVADLQALFLAHNQRYFSEDVVFVAFSDQVEPIGPMPTLTRSVPVETSQGFVRTDHLKRGDLVRTEQTGLVPVLHTVKRTVPARGSFAPVRLRAPYFGLQQDIIVAPDQRLVIRGSEVEYLFGREAVLVPARHLVNGTVALPQQFSQTITYTQVILPRHEAMILAGAPAESLYIGRLRRKPDHLQASVLADVNRNDLPEHGQAAFPVLRWFDAITLAEQRAA